MLENFWMIITPMYVSVSTVILKKSNVVKLLKSQQKLCFYCRNTVLVCIYILHPPSQILKVLVSIRLEWMCYQYLDVLNDVKLKICFFVINFNSDALRWILVMDLADLWGMHCQKVESTEGSKTQTVFDKRPIFWIRPIEDIDFLYFWIQWWQLGFFRQQMYSEALNN